MSKLLIYTAGLLFFELNRVWRDDCPERLIELQAVIAKEAHGDPLALEMLRLSVKDDLSRNPPPEFRGGGEFIDGLPRAYKDFAKWFKRFGGEGSFAAKELLRWGEIAVKRYHESDDFFELLYPFTIGSQQIGHFGEKRSQKVFRLYATVLWREKVKPLYEHKNAKGRDVPSLSALTVDGVQRSMVARNINPARVEDDHHFSDRSGNLLLAVPHYDDAILKRVFSGINKISSLTGVRVLQYIVREGCRRAYVGEKKPEQLLIEGGYTEFAKLCGIKSHRGPTEVREVLHAMARGVYQFGYGRQGNLITINESSTTFKGHSSWILITVAPVLMPDFVERIKSLREKKRLVPLLPEPPYIGRGNEHGRQWFLQLLVVKEFVDNAREFEEEGAITITEETLRLLGEQAGLKPSLTEKVWRGWLDAGRPFIKVGEDRYTLVENLGRHAEFISDLSRIAKSIKARGGK